MNPLRRLKPWLASLVVPTHAANDAWGVTKHEEVSRSRPCRPCAGGGLAGHQRKAGKAAASAGNATLRVGDRVGAPAVGAQKLEGFSPFLLIVAAAVIVTIIVVAANDDDEDEPASP